MSAAITWSSLGRRVYFVDGVGVHFRSMRIGGNLAETCLVSLSLNLSVPVMIQIRPSLVSFVGKWMTHLSYMGAQRSVIRSHMSCLELSNDLDTREAVNQAHRA